MKAAFTKEIDFFAERGIEYLDPALTFTEPTLLTRQLFETWGPRLGITEDESDFACEQGWKALDDRSTPTCRRRAARSSRPSRRENRVAILMIGRPYHSDPGLNHGIPEEFQVLGYPILSMRSIPKDPRLARPLLRERPQGGAHRDAARDATTCGRRTTRPTARRRCGRRSSRRATRTSSCSICRPSSAATTRRPTASSTRSSRRRPTPYAALHDIDANKPGGSIKIRVKTYAHSLKLHEERLEDTGQRKDELKLRHRREAPRAPRAEAPAAGSAQAAGSGAGSDDQRHEGEGRRVLEARARPTSPNRTRWSRPRTRAWCGSES